MTKRNSSLKGTVRSTARAKSEGDLLFEIGCEEIPAGMIPKASLELKALLQVKLPTAGLLPADVQNSIEAFGAPRRLVAFVRNVRLKQDDVTHEVTGPPKSIAYSDVGVPTRAALSFADKQGISVEELQIAQTTKGPYLIARKISIGKPAAEVLTGILHQVIAEISWPRSMYWTGVTGARFIRPIRWIVALLDGKVVPVSFAEVQSGNHTDGHRFLGSRRIAVSGIADYESKLRKNFILFRPEERRKKIETEIREVTSKRSVRAHSDAGLLDMVTYLNEYPAVISGDFDPVFLELPDEILITVMRGHQKYFAVENRNGGLAPHFLAVINVLQDAKGLIRAGHERVLRARFADARFFWETDQKVKLGEYLPKLAAVTYERRLGSYGDKVERMRSLARWFAEQWFQRGITQADVVAADRAAELAKCDLVTDMVREFTELQGIVGGLYARAQAESDDVADAIYDQYRPEGLDDPIPRNLTGCIIALADKLDSVMACFAVGAIPTGSADPFALRRAALGIVKIILEKKLPLSLSDAIAAAARSLRAHGLRIEASDSAQDQVLAFLIERARFILRERHGFAVDEINAAFAAGADDLVDAMQRMTALKAIRGTRNFPPLAAAFKRIRNILEKSVGESDKSQGAVREDLLKETPEMQLYAISKRISEESGVRKREKKYRAALEKISELRPSVDLFFDKVLVMDQNEDVRRNRIALLGGLLKEFSTIADFSELAVEAVK